MKLFTILMAAALSVCAVLYPSAQKEVPAVETTPAVVEPAPQMQAPFAVPLKNDTTHALEEKQANLPVQEEETTQETLPSKEMEELQEKLPPQELKQYNMTAEEELLVLEETVMSVEEKSIPGDMTAESIAASAADTPIEEPAVMKEPAPVVDTAVIVEHAKTGYEGEDTTPVAPPATEPAVPTASGDVSAAIAAAEAFAVETYNVSIDETLDFTNSGYRFPTAVLLTADQETMNTQAIGIVDYTFQQMMRRNGVSIEKMREAGIRCKVYVEQTDHDYLIYCFYA